MKNRIKKFAVIILGGVLASVLTACQWLVSDVTKLDLELVATGDVNPDHTGRASPVVVRIIELKNTAVFENADFYALYDHEKDTLGGDYVSSEEFEIKPGDIRDIKIALGPDSGYIAVLAAYRRMDTSRWRMVLPLVKADKNALTLILNQRGIELATRGHTQND